MYLIYRIEHPFFERYKINPDPWPWQENRDEWIKLMKKSLLLVTFNSFVSLPALLIGIMPLKDWKIDWSFSNEDLPDWKTLAATVVFCMICEDFCFHFMHKMLHTKYLYRLIHKIHHEHKITIGLAAEYSHPLEFIFGAALPSACGTFILGNRCHFVTHLIWNIVRIFESLDGHCGYEFSWSPYRLIPFSTSASYHAFHHSHNIGNYSSFFSLWDTLTGSNSIYYKHQEKIR